MCGEIDEQVVVGQDLLEQFRVMSKMLGLAPGPAAGKGPTGLAAPEGRAAYMEQIFRDGLGQGPGASYLELRLQHARRMLADTSHPVQEVALRSGFADRTVFSRAYRRRFGLSPRQVRKPAVR